MDRPPPNRLPKRAGSGRFPIRVRTSSSQQSTGEAEAPLTSASSIASASAAVSSSSTSSGSAAAVTASSSNATGPSQRLPVPPSSRVPPRLELQSNGGPRRPGVAPLIMGNERLRSNSEGLVQGVRTKRMGMVSRKTSELGTVDEVRTSRFSHYRGLSHGSVMQGQHGHGQSHPHGHARGHPGSGSGSGHAVDRNGMGLENGGSPVSPTEAERPRAQYARRLSSLPERRPPTPASMDRQSLEGVKSVLYSLALLHPHIYTAITAIRDPSPASRRTSLERVFYNASTHVEELDRALDQVSAVAGHDKHAARHAATMARKACLTCVMAYQQVAALLLRHVDQIVQQVDARYVRTLMLLVYNGLLELRNGSTNLFPPDPRHGDRAPDSAITPTQPHPHWGAPRGAPMGGNTSSRSQMEVPTHRMRGHGPTPSGHYYPTRPVVPSNASSRAGSLTSAITPTPLSAESFYHPATPMDVLPRPELIAPPPPSMTTTTPTTAREDSSDERLFERIFVKLTHADDVVLRALPSVKQQFVRCIEVCQKSETEAELRAIWTTLEAKCSLSIQMAERLKAKLLAMLTVGGPEVRNDREFWQICNSFVKAFVETALLVKDARGLELIPTDIVQLLRPVSKAVKEAGMLIETSPWRYLAAASASARNHSVAAPLHLPNAPSSSFSSNMSTHPTPSSSPYMAPMPATPLSAALGPAAQATVPSSASTTMSSTSSTNTVRNGVFSGNVFERADTLLSAPSRSMTMNSTSYSHGHAGSSSIVSPLSSRNHTRAP
ncbi:MAG: RAM signaling network component [Watsoniomyces obsoletus]|nr:MAG: RAM signaling network component [Watsoniomyces obsoletus]